MIRFFRNYRKLMEIAENYNVLREQVRFVANESSITVEGMRDLNKRFDQVVKEIFDLQTPIKKINDRLTRGDKVAIGMNEELKILARDLNSLKGSCAKNSDTNDLVVKKIGTLGASIAKLERRLGSHIQEAEEKEEERKKFLADVRGKAVGKVVADMDTMIAKPLLKSGIDENPKPARKRKAAK